MSSPAVPLPKEQLRYHLHRLGTRRRVASLFGAKLGRVCAALPVEDIDRLHAGQLVQIGRILAKRCCGCGVTREVAQFKERQGTKSGCGGLCKHCRSKKRTA